MFRFIILLLFLTIYFAVSIPIQLIELILQKFNMNARNKSSLVIVKGAFKVVCFITGAKITVKGKENIPTDEAVLFVGNHNSLYDVITTYISMDRPTGYIAKKELKKVPFLSWWMYFVNCIFLDRKDPRAGLKSILHASDMIISGVSIFVFPEGTRSKDGKLLEFKEGSMKIATKAKCPIVPVGITGTPELFEKQFPKLRPNKVTITFGEPIYTKDLSRDEQKNLGALTKEKIAKIIGQ